MKPVMPGTKARVLPVDVRKYYSRTYHDTGQPYTGLGAWLNYRQRQLLTSKLK